MSSVNTSGSLIRDAVSLCAGAIETLSGSQKEMQSKYRSAGNGWTDSKYQQLGDIMNECSSSIKKTMNELSGCLASLNRIEQIVTEYESINLDGSMSFVGGFASEGSLGDAASINAISDSASTIPVTCCGVQINSGAIDGAYAGHLETRYASANASVKMVYDRYANAVVVQSTTLSDDAAHYNPLSTSTRSRGVYYNADNDSSNPRGSGATFYHEAGHMIDHAATGFNGYVSNNSEFGEALRQDGQNVLEAYHRLPPDRQQSFMDRIRQDSSHSLSDLLDATTGGIIRGRYRHSPEYWTGDGNLQAEGFAHFFEAGMGEEEKLSLLACFFPNAYNVFTGMIQSLSLDSGLRGGVIQ